MKKHLLLAACAAVLPHAAATGLDASANLALTSDYRYRGISQTRLQPAVQAGADLAADGWYAGAWVSSIAWTRDAGGAGSIELDLYGGRRGALGAGFGYDAGLLGYVYPSNGLARVAGFANANTLEAYGQLGYRSAALKYSHALTNLFGMPGTRRSGYLELNLTLPTPSSATTLALHLGRQHVRHLDAASYTDWKAALAHDFGAAILTIAGIGTNARERAYSSPANGRFLGRSAVQVTLARTF